MSLRIRNGPGFWSWRNWPRSTWPRSLRGRLVLAAVVVGVAFAVVFGVAGTVLLHRVEDRSIHSALLARLDVARDAVAADGTLLPDRGGAGLVQVIGSDGAVLATSPDLSGVGPLASPADVAAAGRGGLRVQRALQQPDIDLAALAVPIRLRSAAGHSSGVLVVAVDAEGFTAAASDLRQLLMAGLLLVVLTVGALTWLLAGRALHSVTDLTEGAETVSVAGARQLLPTPGRDRELARLVAALNRMLDRLRAAHARELAFAADAGHRLRTPVATLRAEAELALRDSTPEEQQAALMRIVGDADQLASLIDRMLARNRAAGPAWADLDEELGAGKERWLRRAQLAGVTLLVSRVPAKGHRPCLVPDLAEILDPLVDNAVRHARPKGKVAVITSVGGTDAAGATVVTVEVTDDGPGVPAELAERIFDAWVSSRDASVAGGLGLWLARETARDAGGDVTLASGQGCTTFRAELPTRPPFVAPSKDSA